MLFGYIPERAATDDLLRRTRDGSGGVVEFTGEMGSGKSALLDDAAEKAADMRVLRAEGCRSEARYPYALLGLLLNPLAGQVSELPDEQGSQLHRVLWGGERDTVDRLRVCHAVLALLGAAARERPLVCLVDDLHWADRESVEVLSFVARRAGTQPIAWFTSERESLFANSGHTSTAGTRMPLRGLDECEATRMLKTRVPDLVPSVRQRVVAEARGIPAALCDISHALTPTQRAGSINPFTLYDGTPSSPTSAHAEFHERFGGLPESTVLLALTVAACDSDDLSPVRAATYDLGCRDEDLDHAERSGLLEVGASTVRFAHPLWRLVMYCNATAVQRQAVHTALSESDTPHAARIWHAAAASYENDAVAAGLAEAALHTPHEKAYAAYDRAAAHATERGRRARYYMAAADSAVEAGLFDEAARLADAAAAVDLPAQRLRVAKVRAAVDGERGTAAEGPNPRIVTLLDEPLRLREAEDHVTHCRDSGAGRRLPYALLALGIALLGEDEYARAREVFREGLELCEETGRPNCAVLLKSHLAWCAACEGDEALSSVLAQECRAHVERHHGPAVAPGVVLWAHARADMGRARYRGALGQLTALWGSEGVPRSAGVAADLVESAVRSARSGLAERPFKWLTELNSGQSAQMVAFSSYDGLVARCQALLSEGEEARRWYEEAAMIFEKHGHRVEWARCELLYGEWLRRSRRRREARKHLHAAEAVFTECGAQGWLWRVRSELAVCAGKRGGRPSRSGLTEQEANVVRLAAHGRTNPQIAEELFLSPRTVANHLYRAFPKLGVTSRDQLGALRPDEACY
ncbi:AAA family ATPase [Streptomyces sp. ISL-112]|uniref:helix-turn-helix transcriptional regulator n=1 Tax=unclassified Streptomyces TaxID=2593676 RepID=UPI001BE5AB6B|nr:MULTISPECIES: LuxR family transcriptional regulator [unclassified Streptomyces]MBT2424294.1 AAA family ATPase [Streptomyces sp. ISL-112]MBT2463614.1 AAA family ATPase [Streptomyces sp. ISL-63]